MKTLRILAWAWACALAFVLTLGVLGFIWATMPANAQACQTWETGQAAAAAHVENTGDRVGGVLLTPEESAATWAALFPESQVASPHRIGIHIVSSMADRAFVAGFDDKGCLTGAAAMPFQKVLDAMATAGVTSEFVPVEPEAASEGA